MKPSDKIKKCICTLNPNSTGLSLDHFEKDFEFNFQTLRIVKSLTVLECKDCETTWLLDNNSINRFCYRIYSQRQIDLLEEWEVMETKASHLKIFAEQIGTSSIDFIEYPCKATLNDGEILDMCILTKWSHHPLISWQSIKVSKFLYSSQVKQIEPSEYALNLTNRITMRNSLLDFYRDYVPLVFVHDKETFFRDEGCKTFYFDSNFLRHEDIKGTDIKEVNQDIKTYSNYKEKDDLKEEVTLILFDEW